MMLIQSWSHRAAAWKPTIFPKASIRVVVPNAVTVVALCFGLTAVKMAFDGRYELAAAAVLFAALLDGIDGRLARMLRGTSKFGAELDSLADSIAFGVAPALLLYVWILNTLGPVGWLVALVFAVAIALRLARFNVGIGLPDVEGWRGDFFCGMPAPAAAATVLLPVYLSFTSVPSLPPVLIAFYVVAIAALAISRVPFYSGKKSGFQFLRRSKLAVLVLAAVFAAALILHPWAALSGGIVAFLASVPLGIRHYRRFAAGARRLAHGP